MIDQFDLGEFDFSSFSDAEEIQVDTNESNTEQIVDMIVLIDASNSMAGHRIGAVNDIVNNIINKTKSIAKSRKKVNVALLGFSNKIFRWTQNLIPINSFTYSCVEAVTGFTDINLIMAEAINLTQNSLSDSSKRYVILFSDGLPTVEYKETMDLWRSISSEKNIVSIGVTFEDEKDDIQVKEFFNSFSGTEEIYTINQQEAILEKILG